jgi:large subunit ribosomal protein L18
MRKQKIVNGQRLRRGYRVRKAVRGSTERPRMSVFRSHRNLMVQVIDDQTGRTVVSASTEEKEFKSSSAYGGNSNAAVKLGQLIAERAKAAGVTKVCFDRGPYQYHGRVAALAAAAREAGLDF